jgi:hypothetical protein
MRALRDDPLGLRTYFTQFPTRNVIFFWTLASARDRGPKDWKKAQAPVWLVAPLAFAVQGKRRNRDE